MIKNYKLKTGEYITDQGSCPFVPLWFNHQTMKLLWSKTSQYPIGVMIGSTMYRLDETPAAAPAPSPTPTPTPSTSTKPKFGGTSNTPSSTIPKGKDQLSTQATIDATKAKDKAIVDEYISKVEISGVVGQLRFAISARKDLIQSLSETKKDLNTTLNTVPIDEVRVNGLKANIAGTQQSIDALNATIKTLTPKADQAATLYKKSLKELQYIYANDKLPPKSKNSSGTSGSKPDSGAAGKPFKYNLPMVSEAYLGQGIQQQVLSNPGLIISGQNDSNAVPWDNTLPAKGIIRMSKYFSDLAIKSTNTGTSSNYIQDDTPYGFKFLYNPTSVSMAWGIVDQFSPQFVASGGDKANAISAGLMKSAITFSLVINRIGDMSYIWPKTNNHKTNKTNTSPYPVNVPSDSDELQDIWKRGTMYDIEYLFKAISGYNAGYQSNLNGTTWDRGWLNPIPVELHLGDGLRYLVRISSLDLEHKIFNERMVPVLSTVNITCTRYFDGPEMFVSSADITTAALAAGKDTTTTVIK